MNDNKKIGIITLHQITNYGGILQAYALQHAIAKLEYDVDVIEQSLYTKPLHMCQKLILYPWRTLLKKVFRCKIGIRKEENQNETARLRYAAAEYTMPFIKKHIHHRYVQSLNEIGSDEYMAYVVGSDQIWRPAYVIDVKMSLEDAYLQFTKNWSVKRISYAASFGSEEWEYSEEQTNRCKELLSKFNAVSCREEAGTEFCKRYFDFHKAETVIDPTMLLNKEEYTALIGDYNEAIDGDLMCYILDNNEQNKQIVNYVANKEHLTPFSVKAKAEYNIKAPIEDRLQPPVERWLKGVKDAKYIITDSYHACAFSIIFRKPFIAIANQNRGVARYKTLLAYFGLEDRLITGYDQKRIDTILKQPMAIDEKKMQELQEKAMQFLQENLK